MGEIRIKSGNLADGELEQGGVSVSGDIITSSVRVRGYAYVKPQTAYTIASNKAFRMCYGYNDDGTNINKVGRIFDNNSGNNKLSTFTTPEGCNYIGFAIWNGDETNIVPTDVQNLILVEGTYTSETIPEYQPYFLNKPAHQYVNGEWIDIPTHKYINGRWQGELTSQSPLKFRADGEMLDWRVEGRTSGNLFDVKHFVDTAYCHNVVLTQLDNNGIKIQATSSTDPYVNYTYWVIGQALPGSMRNAAIPCKSNTDYTLCCAQSSKVGKYISYFDKDYKVVKGHTPFSTELLNFKTPENCAYILLRIGDSSTLSEGTIVELTNIQLLEGTYTSDTLPPYEPYGGVGDYDETEQKYRIPVTVNGENLYSGAWEQGYWTYDRGGPATVQTYVRTPKISCNGNTKYKFDCSLPDGSKNYGFVFWNSNGVHVGAAYDTVVQNTPVSFSATSPANAAYMAIDIAIYSSGERHPADILSFDLYELHETNLYTNTQLMDGDSIDYTTTETQIPIATGNNTLTVDTAVKPKSVFVKFEG